MNVPRFHSGPVQLLGLSLGGMTAERPLLAFPPEPGLPDVFGDALPGARYHYADFTAFRSDRERAAPEARGRFSFSHRVGALDPPADLAVIFFPKGRARAAYLLQEVAQTLEPGTPVWVVGENRGGIRSGHALIAGAIGPVVESRAARHSLLLQAVRGEGAPRMDLRKTFAFAAWGREVTVVSYPGVFSHGELDPGTRWLLDAMEPPVFHRALDWGCGSGAIGTALALAHPAGTVDLIDSDALAVASARETLAANRLDPAWVRPSDGFSEVQGSFDLIVANPPFHAGLRTERRLTDRMLAESPRFLLPGGRLVFVSNAHHDFRRPLSRSFEHIRVVAEDRRYRVIEANQEAGSVFPST